VGTLLVTKMSGVCTDDDHALKVDAIPPGEEKT
jgi:hypothetical protein